MVSKVFFPRLVAPLSSVVPGLVDLAIASVVLVGMLVVYDVTPSWAILLTPAWVIAALAVALAVGIPLAAANVRFRDVRHALPLLLQVWLFASPVVYSGSLVEGGWQYVYALNPMVTVLDGFRWSVADGPAGPESRLRRSRARAPRRRPRVLPAGRARLRGRRLMAATAIELDGVSKRFLLGERLGGYVTLREVAASSVRRRRGESPTRTNSGRCATSRSRSVPARRSV